MKQFDAEILENRELAPDCFELSFLWPEGLRAPLPGQFVTVGDRTSVSFLRPRASIATFDRATRTASFFYLARSAGSLAQKRGGEIVDLLGPRGFAFQPVKDKQPLLVGSGAGIGALVFGANSLAAKGYRPRLLLGTAKGSSPAFRLAPEVNCSTTSEEHLVTALGSEDAAGCFVWAAGPNETLRRVHLWSQSSGVPCQVCLETLTACGVGACQGCTVATTGARQFARVCTEGPVFSSEVIQWT